MNRCVHQGGVTEPTSSVSSGVSDTALLVTSSTGLRGALVRWGARLPDGLGDAIWLWLLLRVNLSILTLWVVVTKTAQSPCPAETHLAWLPRDGLGFQLLGAWYHWDACWYTTIASVGYGMDSSTGETTFFPLLPLLARGLAGIKSNLPIAFAAVNAVALIMALTGLRQLVTHDFDRRTAKRTAQYIVVFPAAFFLIAPFTESLFLVGSIWAFLGARQRRWEITLIAGVIAGLARPQGVLLMLPLGWEAGRMLWERWHAGEPRVRQADLIVGLAVTMPGIVNALYMIYSASFVGRSYWDSNARWGRHHLVWPWERLIAGVTYGLEQGSPVQLLNAVIWLLFAGLTIAGIRLLPVSYWVYVIPQLVLTLTQETVWPLMSTVRYAIVLFPCFVVLAIAGRNQRFHTWWVMLSSLLLGALTIQFIQGAMVG